MNILRVSVLVSLLGLQVLCSPGRADDTRETDLVTKPGEYKFWMGRVVIQVEEAEKGSLCKVKFQRIKSSSEFGTPEPGLPKEAKWFIYAVSDCRVFVYKGEASVILLNFEEGILPGGGNRLSAAELKPGAQNEPVTKDLFAKLPKKVLDRLPAGFRGKDNDK